MELYKNSPKVLILTDWMYRSFIVNNVPFKEKIYLNEVEKIFVDDNLNKLVELNKNFQLDGVDISLGSIGDIILPSGDRSINYYSSPIIHNTVTGLIDSIDDPTEIGEGPSYEIITKSGYLVLVVRDYFYKSMRINSNLVKFIKDYLMSIENVFNCKEDLLGIYELYINSLSPE